MNRLKSRLVWLPVILGPLLYTPLASAEQPTPVQDPNDFRFLVEVSEGGDELRTTEVRKYFENLDRKFEVYRVRPKQPTPAGKRYMLHRERAGDFRYTSLKIVQQLFFGKVARSVRESFVPLEDTVHHDDSEVTGEELLQIIYRNARSLRKQKADLETVTNGVTLTYVYDDFETVLMPTNFNYVDHAVNTDGTSLRQDYGVNSFSKHYLLALILNGKAEVTMAGKLYIAVRPLDEDSPIDLDHVFLPDGDVDLDHYEFYVMVTNDSGTFKPDAQEVPLFAQALVDALNIPEMHYSAWSPEGEPRVEGMVTPSH